MSVTLVDSTGATIWLGDTVSTSQGSGTVIALIEATDTTPDQVTVSISGVESIFAATSVTVTSRASESSSDADQAQAGEVI